MLPASLYVGIITVSCGTKSLYWPELVNLEIMATINMNKMNMNSIINKALENMIINDSISQMKGYMNYIKIT